MFLSLISNRDNTVNKEEKKTRHQYNIHVTFEEKSNGVCKGVRIYQKHLNSGLNKRLKVNVLQIL